MTPEMARQGDGSTTFGDAGSLVSLNDLAMRMLQRLVQHAARGDGGEDGHVDGELKEMLRRACRAAHQSGLHAEQLVIILKDAWTRVPNTARRSGRDVEEAFNQLVSLCIEEFYTAGSGL